MNLTSAQKRTYFDTRFDGQRLPEAGRNPMVRCPFHDYRTASLSIKPDDGIWKCHAGCGQGGLLEFEKQFSHCDDAQAWANIYEVCGVPNPNRREYRGQPEAVYTYRDEDRK